LSGDSKYSASTPSAQTLVVNPIASTITLSASATTATTGTSITFTATVSRVRQYRSHRHRHLQRWNNSYRNRNSRCGGKATYGTSKLAVGNHSVTAVYSGDADNGVSTSAPLSITINTPPAADFTFLLSANSGSVTAGGPASVTATVTPLNGFNAATTFACSGLPSHSTCNFSPSSVTPNGTAATTTLTINSNVATAAISGGGAILSFLLIPVFWKRHGKRHHLARFSILALLLAMVALGICACGAGSNVGGGGGNGSNSNTPKGTYPITITATSGSLSHSATYSFTVN
jgi:hypothetical protein